MTQSIGKSQQEESLSSIILPSRHLYNQLWSISSLIKIAILGLFVALFFLFIHYYYKAYIPSYIEIYEDFPEFFPVISILTIFAGFSLWVAGIFTIFDFLDPFIKFCCS